MKAIQTKFFGATNTKGARIKVWAEDNKVKFVPYDHGLDLDQQSEKIAAEYAESLGWLQNGRYALHTGSIATGYVHVLYYIGI
jgi:hypothetical protein